MFSPTGRAKPCLTSGGEAAPATPLLLGLLISRSHHRAPKPHRRRFCYSVSWFQADISPSDGEA